MTSEFNDNFANEAERRDYEELSAKISDLINDEAGLADIIDGYAELSRAIYGLVEVDAGLAAALAKSGRNAVRPLNDAAALYGLLADQDFADFAFEVLAVSLVGHAYRVIIEWLNSDIIFQECADRGAPVHPSDAELRHLHSQPDEVTEIANEILGEALVQLRQDSVNAERRWSVASNIPLKGHFVGICVQHFPNVYRRWCREFRQRPPAESDRCDRNDVKLEPSADTARLIISVSRMAKKMPTLPPTVRRITELRLQGHSYAEIAGVTSTGPVDDVLRRYREGYRQAL